MEEVRSRFCDIERMRLAPLETPVQELGFVREMYPEGPRVFIKRDDFIGPMVWGNKLRKLEYTLAEARRQGADTLITTGGIQSNHARTTAQVALQEGFEPILVLNGERPVNPGGNYLINEKLGIEIHLVPDRLDRRPKMLEIAEQVRAAGKNPFLIPLGASDQYGTLGFVNAAAEIKLQEAELGVEFDHIVHASSSGGTQAGLILGSKIFNLKGRILGISADSTYAELSESIHAAADPILEKIGSKEQIVSDDIYVEEGYIGEGYGIPTQASKDTELLLATKGGILVDHTYSGKAFAGLLDYIELGKFTHDDNILFWHTGGTISLFQ